MFKKPLLAIIFSVLSTQLAWASHKEDDHKKSPPKLSIQENLPDEFKKATALLDSRFDALNGVKSFLDAFQPDQNEQYFHYLDVPLEELSTFIKRTLNTVIAHLHCLESIIETIHSPGLVNSNRHLVHSFEMALDGIIHRPNIEDEVRSTWLDFLFSVTQKDIMDVREMMARYEMNISPRSPSTRRVSFTDSSRLSSSGNLLQKLSPRSSQTSSSPVNISPDTSPRSRSLTRSSAKARVGSMEIRNEATKASAKLNILLTRSSTEVREVKSDEDKTILDLRRNKTSNERPRRESLGSEYEDEELRAKQEIAIKLKAFTAYKALFLAEDPYALVYLEDLRTLCNLLGLEVKSSASSLREMPHQELEFYYKGLRVAVIRAPKEELPLDYVSKFLIKHALDVIIGEDFKVLL